MICFQTIKLENFRCFKSLEVDLSVPNDDNICVLVAPNGQGKTAILDALAYLLAPLFSRLGCAVPHLKSSDYRCVMSLDESFVYFQSVEQAPYMRLSARLRLEDEQEIGWDITKIRDKSTKTRMSIPQGLKLGQINAFSDTIIERINEIALGTSRGKKIPIFAYFNTQRSSIWKKPERRLNFKKQFKRLDAYKNALNGVLDYKGLCTWILFIEELHWRKKDVAFAYSQRPDGGNLVLKEAFNCRSLEMRTIDLAFERMLPTLSNLRTVINPLRLVVDVRSGDEKRVCALESQLSDGYKNVISLVLTLVQRMLDANSVQANDDPQEVLNTEGVVLIDEVDLFLHPSWQQRILKDLRLTFPNIQFIVSTHSPQVIASVPKECIRLITPDAVRELTNPTQGVEVAEILQSVFGTFETDLNLKIVKNLEQLKILTCEGKGDTQEWHKLYQELVTYYGENYGPLKGVVLHKEFLKSLKGN